MRSGFKLGTILSLCVAAAMASCGSDEPSSASTCGNGVVEGSELCEGQSVGAATCASATSGAMPNGVLTCDPATCSFNVSQCTGSSMGGGMNP